MAFPDGVADFRSDTVTRPTQAMRRAMAEADVGDDVYSDDPTVNLLEEEAAAAVGKQAAVFVPSGTMGNQLAVMSQTRPGDEVLCDAGAHVRNVERGASSALSGVGFRPVAVDGGRLTGAAVDEAMALAGRFYPPISLIVWENSHNLSGGRVIPVEVMDDTNVVARTHELRIHLDGARIFNAAIALGVDASRLAMGVDTVQFCFSKGLGAPVGSVLCGDADDMDHVRYLRKRMGGGMRQVGVIAAPARIGLAERERLIDDHVLARYLAEGIEGLFPGAASPAKVDTNIVNVAISALPMPYTSIAAQMDTAGIRVNAPFGDTWRLVTHRDVNRADADRLLTALSKEG